MAQFYRAIYEIREMNLWNTVKTKIWQSDNISLELFLENRELGFYVVANEYYKGILENKLPPFTMTRKLCS